MLLSSVVLWVSGSVVAALELAARSLVSVGLGLVVVLLSPWALGSAVVLFTRSRGPCLQGSRGPWWEARRSLSLLRRSSSGDQSEPSVGLGEHQYSFSARRMASYACASTTEPSTTRPSSMPSRCPG
jgi:hypothetical protein